MKRLEQLPEIAEHTLGGLTAGGELKGRIYARAAQKEKQPLFTVQRFAALATCALVLAIGVTVSFPRNRAIYPNQGPLITSQAAGNGTVQNERALDLNRDSVTVSNQKSTPSFRSIWATGKSAFPLIGVDGAYYRMLTSPASVDSSLLGNSLGEVTEFNADPALSSADGIVSNKAVTGTAVYSINNMGNTFVAADVDGTTRLFQRVSFNGKALQGKEKLSNTLTINGHVTALELSDVGTISDADTCNKLMSTLLDHASFESNGSLSGKQSLIVTLDNGLMLQLSIKNDKFAACGVWSCPEFFEDFAAAVE